ncbi:septation protein A [Legionella spiritensis]|uniref:Inner membrane-spanning protein YciB n=1 Tax=Legionella spiritensis TaxID=452 RepID=A0A0W0Z8L3_LEGSP|nr:septation protein A [Legionella spiritensis]KTD65469.1 intracellular septation protein A [Legionella spiritensis]SNV35802.1 intracellular septation protein [Legionella spiritensis]VEG89858.1 intracellular septation protein [Legionella spiritensis]
MKLLFDFFPVLLFFLTYKLYGIYYATAIAMIASVGQVAFYRLKHHRYEKMHLTSMALIVILGAATLIFHDPWFIKWKPTGIYWFAALFFLGSRFVGNKTIIQKMMEENINLPIKIWYRLNYAWFLFFIFMGILNLYVAYNFSTDTWVNFKLFGGAGLTLIFVVLQAIYLSRHMIEKEVVQQSSADSEKSLPKY